MSQPKDNKTERFITIRSDLLSVVGHTRGHTDRYRTKLEMNYNLSLILIIFRFDASKIHNQKSYSGVII